jgi:dipeptide/tripeptide permease
VLLTVSELLLVPLSLSLVESIAPPRRGATYTGIYYLGVAAGSQLGSDLARLWGALAAPLYFLLIALIPLVACGLLLALRQHIDSTQDSR